MKDPKVSKLVEQFHKEVSTLNATWKKLQENDVYVRIDLKGSHTYNEPKYIEIDSVTQSVSYDQ